MYKVARDDLEKKLGKTVISKNNALNYKYLDGNKLEKDIVLENGQNGKLE